MTWIVPIPIWGSRWYFDKFIHAALPSINAALEHAAREARFIIHTDQPEFLKKGKYCGTLETRPIQTLECLYHTYGNCNRQVLDVANDGEHIAFLASDILVSQEFFKASEARFEQGKRAVVGTAARTIPNGKFPIGASSRRLLDWSFASQRQHEVTKGCYWGRGKNAVSWMTYFEGQRGTVGRAFHLHPFAVHVDRYLWFGKTTVDLDLLERFTHDEIHVVTDIDEMSFCELSGHEKAIQQRSEPISERSILSWCNHPTTCLLPIHKWMFANHRIVVQGDGSDMLDVEPCRQVIEALGGVE
jgi:hypothetical protein